MPVNSHEKLRGRRVVVAARSVFSEAAADELFVLLFVRVSLAHQSGDLLLEVVHLLQQLGLLALQDVPLLDPLVAARLGIASVFEGPPLLFQPDHLLFTDPPQVPVELAHGHGHQLLVREAIVQVHVLVADGAAVGLHAGCRMVTPRVVVMVVVVVVWRAVLGCGGRDDRGDHRGGGSHLLAGHGASSAGCAGELLPSSIAVEALELVTAVDQRLHRVLGAEAQSLWVELLLITGHPVEILQVSLLFAPGARAGRREAWGRGNRAARRAHRGGRQGSPGDQAAALDDAAIGLHRLLFHFKLHQIEVINIFHGQGTGGQVGAAHCQF